MTLIRFKKKKPLCYGWLQLSAQYPEKIHKNKTILEQISQLRHNSSKLGFITINNYFIHYYKKFSCDIYSKATCDKIFIVQCQTTSSDLNAM